MGTSQQTAPARRGRRCECCALDPGRRSQLEQQLLAGHSISRIARHPEMPSRDSIRRHVAGGHLPAALAEKVAAMHGLDTTALAARVVDIAQRAREVGLEALEAGDRRGVLQAGDAELRALSALGSAGINSEADVWMQHGTATMTRAVYAVAKDHPEVAQLIAADLQQRDRDDLADDLLDSIPTPEALEAS